MAWLNFFYLFIFIITIFKNKINAKRKSSCCYNFINCCGAPVSFIFHFTVTLFMMLTMDCGCQYAMQL